MDSHNSNPMQAPEMNRESLEVTVLIGMAAPGAVALAALPKGRKPA